MKSKIVSPNILKLLNDDAVENERNRTIPNEAVTRLDPNGVNLLVPVLFHNDVEIRCMVYMKFQNQVEPSKAFLDVDPELFRWLVNAPELKEESAK